MKSQRRRELKTNPLAVWVGRLVQQIQPYWKLIAAGVVIVVVVWLSALVLASRREAHLQRGWDRLFATLRAQRLEQILKQLQEDEQTKDFRPEEQRREAVARLAEELEAVLQDYAGTAVASYAHVELGDIYYTLGLSHLFQDVEQARQYLDRAVAHYEQVTTGQAPQPELVARARFGLAQALEARGKPSRDEALHDWQRAEEEYTLLTRSPNIFHQLAQERLAAIQRGRFHSWFWETVEEEP